MMKSISRARMLMRGKVSMHVETVVKLSLKKDTPKIEVTMEPDEESNYTPEEKGYLSED